jgi:hypothetical protein
MIAIFLRTMRIAIKPDTEMVAGDIVLRGKTRAGALLEL